MKKQEYKLNNISFTKAVEIGVVDSRFCLDVSAYTYHCLILTFRDSSVYFSELKFPILARQSANNHVRSME